VGWKITDQYHAQAKLIKRGIPKLSTIFTVNGFQAVGMFIVQPQSQASKVLLRVKASLLILFFILTLKNESNLPK
jgi:hypothetical protein